MTTTVSNRCYPDHLGTPRAITTSDASNTKVWEWKNDDPFGNNAVNEDPSATGTAFKYNNRFPGQYFDQETGTNYNRFRDYDPGTGRYVQSDPTGMGGGMNTYSYVGAKPLSAFDPNGLNCVAVGQTVACQYPGGPAVKFPRPPGWPDYIGPGDNNGYHHYNIPVPTSCSADNMRQLIIENPTPGNPSPATPGGTLNDATPPIISGLLNQGEINNESIILNPVLSYLTTDSVSGNPVVVNVTQPGHGLSPGYVVRASTPTSGGSLVNNFGEGLGTMQADGAPLANLINGVWYSQTRGLAKKCGCP